MSQKHKNNEISVPFRFLLLIMVILAALIAGTEPWKSVKKPVPSSEPLLTEQVGRVPSEFVQIETNEVPVSTGPVKFSFRISPKFSDEQPAIPASVTKNSVDQEKK